MSNQKSQRIHYFAAPFTVVLASLLIQIPAFSQEEAVDIPEHFVIVPEASKRLDENIASVQEQFKANYD
ncbi:hypothetical protein GWO43_14180, partial [candidate division KSB1 bacterium]|nr:hypothetical protein [candidate division KSB1 bacterium]NIR72407.1 hypothetical protein [candidate division KSB1 bacterium]NIS25072.1 hypothetical protein [candidate division KSB1 bacterium]NIT71991.1 hypothetical protein [candidate division KSB1 bacterium]NIU25749.1 hypothetical protein [candidate division KSB1 bacterium]